MDEHRTALVTGASSGIGEAIAIALAERGYDLIVSARRQQRLEDLAGRLREQHGIGVSVVPRDLGVHGGAGALYEDVRALGLAPTILVNNAGFGVYGPSLEVDPGRIAAMVELNVVAPTELTHRFARDMCRAGGGRILQVASIGAFQPTPRYAVYAASKAYLLNMSVAMHRELSGSGVTITTLCPGLTATEFDEVAGHRRPASMDFMFMDPRSVAEHGVRAMLAGRAVVTPGLTNKLAGGGVKLVPRSWSTAIVGGLMKGHRKG